MPSRPYKSAASYLMRLAKPHAGWYSLAVSCSLAGVPAALMQTAFTARLIDGVTAGEGLIYAAPLACITLLISLIAYVGQLSGAKLAALASVEMKKGVAKALLKGDFRAVSALRAGDAVRTLGVDTKTVADFLSGQMTSLLSQALTAIGALCFLLAIDPVLCAVTLAYIPFGMFFTLRINGKLGKLYPEEAARSGEALSQMEQALRALPVVKAFAMDGRLLERVRKALQRQTETGEKIGFWQGLLQPACYAVSHLPRMAYMLFAGYLVFEGRLSPGTFLAVMELINYFIGPAVYFPFLLDGLNRAAASMARVKALTDIPCPEHVYSDTQDGRARVSLRNVSFSYGREAVLEGFSLLREGPGLTALSGPSGCGKSTIIRLIQGLLKPDAGDREICGSVGCVPQETWLFRGTLFENIACVDSEAPRDIALSAAERAGLGELAKQLPEGYETRMGDGGAELSGGQKKRLSFARLLLRNADIWLLDEPDASLDAETAACIEKLIVEESSRRRIFMAAHSERMLRLTGDVVTLEGARKGGGAK